MKGIIYRYTSPRGKTYVGQTTDENRRRSQFFDITKPYAGKRMESERKKYPKLNDWKYEVLTTLEEDDPDIFREKLTFLEAYYIIHTSSICWGLNTYLADAETICKNRYLKNYYNDLKDVCEKLEVLNNIDPDQFSCPINEKEYYSSTSFVNDSFWMNEIRNRFRTTNNLLSNCDKKELFKWFKKTEEVNRIFGLHNWPKKNIA